MESDKKYCENCGIEIHPEDILCSDCYEIEMEYLSEVEKDLHLYIVNTIFSHL